MCKYIVGSGNELALSHVMVVGVMTAAAVHYICLLCRSCGTNLAMARRQGNATRPSHRMDRDINNGNPHTDTAVLYHVKDLPLCMHHARLLLYSKCQALPRINHHMVSCNRRRSG